MELHKFDATADNFPTAKEPEGSKTMPQRLRNQKEFNFNSAPRENKQPHNEYGEGSEHDMDEGK